MSLLSKGSEWETHPQGLYIGRLLEVKETQDNFGKKIRWIFETNAKNGDGDPLKVTMKSSYTGLGNEKAWLNKIILGFGHNPADPYWLSFDDLSGFNFLIERKTQIGLEIEHFDKDDGTKGDKVANVMTVDALRERRNQLRASLAAMDGDDAPPATNSNGHKAPPAGSAPPPGGASAPAGIGAPPPGSGTDPFTDE